MKNMIPTNSGLMLLCSIQIAGKEICKVLHGYNIYDLQLSLYTLQLNRLAEFSLQTENRMTTGFITYKVRQLTCILYNWLRSSNL